MVDRSAAELELPTSPRTRRYRFFEGLPAMIGCTAIILVFILPFIDAMLGAVYVFVIVTLTLTLTLMRAMRGAVDVSRGFLRYCLQRTL